MGALTDSETVERVVVFGEVLFDRFPDGCEVLGGAPFNVAWNLQALDARPILVGRVGNDRLGRRILAAMKEWGMDLAGMQVDEHLPTGTVEVALIGGEPRFDIVADRAYDAIDEELIAELPAGFVLYHGSLACRSQQSRAALESLIRRGPGSVFFDVNLRSPWWDEGRVHGLISTANEVKMNENELERLSPGARGRESRVSHLLSRYGCDRLHLTRGAHGAITFALRGGPYEVRPASETEIVDTVGAGDAFSSVLILGRVRDWPLETTLERAQEFAAAVVGLRGATTTERIFYERFTEVWNS